MIKEEKVVLTMMTRKVKFQLTMTAQNLKKLNLKILNKKTCPVICFHFNLTLKIVEN